MKISAWPPTVSRADGEAYSQLESLTRILGKRIDEMSGMVETLTLSALEEEETPYGR